MPGIIGIVAKESVGTLPDSLIDKASGLLPNNSNWPSYRWDSPDLRCSMVGYGREYDRNSRIAVDSDGALLLDGELYGVDGNQAEYLLKKVREEGLRATANIEGRYIAAIFSNSTNRLWVISDKFASRPMYYLDTGRHFAFSSSIFALKSLADGEPKINIDGVIQFFTFGHLWNDDTFYQSIKAAFPATRMEYDSACEKLSHSVYWRPGSAPRESNRQRSLEKMTETFVHSVEQQSHCDEGLGVSLSGGLDARTVLGLIDYARVRPACISLGMEGSLDQQSAKKLTELAGCAFHPLVLGEGFFEQFPLHLSRMVELTDGHYLSQCIVMPTLPLYQSLGIRYLLRGHAGELLHMHKAYNFSVDGSFAEVGDGASLHRWLSKRLQSFLTLGVPEPLLKGVGQNAFAESGELSLRKALSRTEGLDHKLDRLSLLFLEQRTRRETAMSMVKFNSVVEARLPFLNGDFIDSVFASDPQLRVGEQVQTFMLQKHRPEFLKPANSNTGAPVGASPLYRKLCYYRMRLFAKLGIKGYQPYERLGLWLKRELRPFVESILLDPACLDRGLLNADCIRNVVSRHMNSQANHTYLLMAMMIVELGIRQSREANQSQLPAGTAI
jgi:asparagine synthase (glutamine-hydrolysing)